jgi:hypothetical protein
MSTLDTCPASGDQVPERSAGPVSGASSTGAEADQAAARAAMVARLEKEGALGPGPVRDALLTLPREVLIPQAYVRRSAPGESPSRWDLLEEFRRCPGLGTHLWPLNFPGRPCLGVRNGSARGHLVRPRPGWRRRRASARGTADAPPRGLRPTARDSWLRQ